MSLDGITQPQYPLTVDGLSNINATTVYINGQQVVPDVGVYLPLAGGVMGGPIGMAGNVLTGLPTGPSGASDAVPLGYLTSQLTSYVPYSGATGPININGNRLSGLTGPIGTTDAVPLGYLATQLGSYVPYSGATGPININGNLLTATGPTGGIITSNLTLPSLTGPTGTYSNVLGVDANGHVIPIVTPTGPTGAAGYTGATGTTGPGANLLPLNNTWTGTNTFNNTVTNGVGYTTNLNNIIQTSYTSTGQAASNFTTAGLPAGVPSGSTLSGTYRLTAGSSSSAMGMWLGSYSLPQYQEYIFTLTGVVGSQAMTFEVLQYDISTGTTSAVISPTTYAVTTSSQTISGSFVAGQYGSLQGAIVFYFQASSNAQYVNFTGFSMTQGTAVIDGLVKINTSAMTVTGPITVAPYGGTPSLTLGVNSSNQIIAYTNPIQGSVSSTYLPYASSSNVLANSVLTQSSSRIVLNTTTTTPMSIISSGADAYLLFENTSTGGLSYYIGSGGTGSGGGVGNFSIIDGQGGGPRLTITSSGYVGIGTTLPYGPLHVALSSTLVTPTYWNSNQFAIFGGTTNTSPAVALGFGSGSGFNTGGQMISYNPSSGFQPMNFGASSYYWSLAGFNTNSLVLNSAGNLTLTTNNGQPFTIISSGTDSNIYLQATTGGRNYYIGSGGTSSGGGAGNFYIYDGSSGGGLRMAINASGYMALGGSINPTYRLDVNTSGSVRAGSYVAVGYGQDGYAQDRYIDSGGTYGVMWRNDGSNTYLLVTANGSPYGIWNSYRPFYFENGNGNVHLNAGNTGQLIMESSTAYFSNGLPQQTDYYCYPVVLNVNQQLCRSQAVNQNTLNIQGMAWGGGYNTTYCFYRYNSYTSVRLTGKLSYYVSSSGLAYPYVRIYSQSSGQYWYYSLQAFTNGTYNHVTFPFSIIFNDYTPAVSATGWFDVYIYNSSGCNTDTNDQLWLDVQVLPASNF